MKIKVNAEDFIVREESALHFSEKPRAHVVFRLSKQDWDTFDLIDLLARRLGIPTGDISFGGIKDRYGKTEQLISFKNRRGLKAAIGALSPQKNFNLSFLGYLSVPVAAKDILGNHFTITIRDLSAHELERCLANAEIVRQWGIPNYYDEQRFGSARHGKGFMGKEIFRGSRERALRLYFEPSKFDDRRTRALKSCVLENWTHWNRCLESAFGEYRRILTYLSGHRQAFHKALSLIDRRFLVLVLNAYQSFLFNQILSRYLLILQAEHDLDIDRHLYSQGHFLFYRELPEHLNDRLLGQLLPVPGWDSRIEDPRIAEITASVLESEAIELRDLKVRQMSGIYVNGVERSAIVVPQNFAVEGVGEDELYKNSKRMTLKFFLTRGGYATLIVKRLNVGGQAYFAP
ncbi:MAG: tRNA pseudouridine(13) synthase TruD [Spirochaetaceae bacterium]|nr:MAG: tRNA pseudouridine(13) synthase TruD [Spirochaetaceae bacterium]